jgi:hypothetical protein
MSDPRNYSYDSTRLRIDCGSGQCVGGGCIAEYCPVDITDPLTRIRIYLANDTYVSNIISKNTTDGAAYASANQSPFFTAFVPSTATTGFYDLQLLTSPALFLAFRGFWLFSRKSLSPFLTSLGQIPEPLILSLSHLTTPSVFHRLQQLLVLKISSQSPLHLTISISYDG